MKLQAANIRTLKLVTNALVGASGPEIKGGARDGAIDGFMVVGQFELVSPTDLAAGKPEPTVMHLGFTREAALDLAEQLRRAAATLPE